VNPDDPHVEHPIVIPPETEVPPEVEEEQLSFFQRITLGVNWNANSVGTEGEEVGIDAWVPDDPANFDGEGTWRNVRSVPNNGSSSVTYPSDFTGRVRLRVRGSAATVSGQTNVT
jgi:hypothetical protein